VSTWLTVDSDTESDGSITEESRIHCWLTADRFIGFSNTCVGTKVHPKVRYFVKNGIRNGMFPLIVLDPGQF
jgi:hypothetical protein